jgi:hypothetical protein
MEFEPQHFRLYCVSEKEKVMKYPTFTFLLEQFDVDELEKKVKHFVSYRLSTL